MLQVSFASKVACKQTQQLPTLLRQLRANRRDNSQHCCVNCVQTDATTPKIVAPTMLGVVACESAVVCKRMQQLPTLLRQQCWELLRASWQWCGNRRNNSQHCCVNNVESCCVRVGSGVQTDAKTPNIVASTMLTVVACELAVVCKRMQQLPTMLGPAVHRGKDTTHKSL